MRKSDMQNIKKVNTKKGTIIQQNVQKQLRHSVILFVEKINLSDCGPTTG